MAWVAVGTAVVGAASSAYGAHKQSSAAKKAAKAANAPWEEKTVREPWDKAMPYLEGALGENQRVYDETRARYDAATRRGGGGGKGKGKGKGGGGGGGGGGMFSSGTKELADKTKDLALNGDPTLDKARGYVESTLGPGEDGPFGGNEIRNDLYNRLEGADFDRSTNLLEQYLAGKVGSQSSDYAGRSGGAPNRTNAAGGRAGSSGTGTNFRYSSDRGGTGGGSSGSSRTKGGLPDTMDDETSFFNQQMKEYFDDSQLDPANNPALAPYIEQLKREMGEDLDAQLDDVGDASNMTGMFGGSGRALEAARTREEGQEALGSTLANVYMKDYGDAQARRMQGLGMISERDQAAMADATNRYGIGQSARSASASAQAAADAQRYGVDAQMQLGMRGQDLDAINSIMGHDEAGLGMLGQLGGDLADERQWGVGAASNLHSQQMGDLGDAFGMFQGMDQMQAQARAQAAARADAQARFRGQQARQDALMGQSMYGDYLKGLGGIVGMGPETTTQSGFGGRGESAAYMGPSGLEAGLSSMGGSMMALYGMGAFDNVGRNRAPQVQQQQMPMMDVPARQYTF